MRAKPGLQVTALAAGLLATGCGGDDGLPALGEAVTVSPPPAAAPVPDSAELGEALLDATQLPAGFGELPDPGTLLPGESAPPQDSSITDPAECAAVLVPIAELSPGSAGRALSRFQGLDFNSIDIDAASYAPDQVAPVFAHVQELFARCTEYRGEDSEGVDVTYRLGAFDAARSGDASVGVRLLTESEGVTLTTDVVVMVIGTTIVQFAATGPQPIGTEVLADLAGRQAEQVRAIG